MCVVGIQSEIVRTYLSSVEGTFWWSSATAGEYTRLVCLSDPQVSLFTWETSGSLPFAWSTSGSLPRIFAFRPKVQTLCCLFKSHAEVWTSSSPHVFFCLWLVIGTYIILFFPVICSSICERKYLSLYPLAINYIFRHPPLFSSLCWCYLVTIKVSCNNTRLYLACCNKCWTLSRRFSHGDYWLFMLIFMHSCPFVYDVTRGENHRLLAKANEYIFFNECFFLYSIFYIIHFSFIFS